MADILTKGINWIARGVEAGLEESVVKGIVGSGNASAQRRLVKTIAQAEQKNAIKTTEKVVAESVEKNSVKQADKQLLSLATENDKVTSEIKIAAENEHFLQHAPKQYEQPSLFGDAPEIVSNTNTDPEPIIQGKNLAEMSPKKANLHAEQMSLFDSSKTELNGSVNIDALNNGTESAGITIASGYDTEIGLSKTQQQIKELAAGRKNPVTQDNEMPANYGVHYGPYRKTGTSEDKVLRARDKYVLDADQKRQLDLMREAEGNTTDNAGMMEDMLSATEETSTITPNSDEKAWSQSAKAVLGTAVGGAALMAALSSSRGQQNNAQLYGQQPLY